MPSLWRLPDPLLLASTSLTRRTLLVDAGLPVETGPSGVDERGVEAELGAVGPVELAEALAREKALAVSRRRPGRLVLGADQTLSVDGERLHKPSDRTAAAAQIARLEGRTHELCAAAALARDGVVVATFSAGARLTMRPLSAEQIALYLDLAGAGATVSVGAYQIDGVGLHLFAAVEGDHATILGLPLLPLLAALRGLGALAL